MEIERGQKENSQFIGNTNITKDTLEMLENTKRCQPNGTEGGTWEG